MFEPVSTAVGILWLGHSALYASARASSAISSEAHVISEAASAILTSAERSQVLLGEKMKAIVDLMAIAQECAAAGWDGYGAVPINPAAIRNAENLVRAFPDSLPLPELAPEPDGSISFDWIRSRHRLLSLSAGASNRLAYAWLDGNDKGRGVVRFDGISIPPRLLDDIRRIVINGDAALRVA